MHLGFGQYKSNFISTLVKLYTLLCSYQLETRAVGGDQGLIPVRT